MILLFYITFLSGILNLGLGIKGKVRRTEKQWQSPQMEI